MREKGWIGWIIWLVLCACAWGAQTNTCNNPTFLLLWENDRFTGLFGPNQDRHYTQGFKLAYFTADDDLPASWRRWTARLPTFGLTPSAENMGVVLGQNMYTPDDLTNPEPIYEDRPYAGWLYVGVAWQRRGTTASGRMAALDSVELNLGVIGPASLAGDLQTYWHRKFDPYDIPAGWCHQLPNEPGLVVKAARYWRWSPTSETANWLDVIPHAGVSVGNVLIAGHLGAMARLGWNLPADFGVAVIDAPATPHAHTDRVRPPWGGYIFARLEGRAVGRNIFLDGSTWTTSLSVPKEYFVADLVAGAAVQFTRYCQLAYTYVARSPEFVGQDGWDRFASLLLQVQFCF